MQNVPKDRVRLIMYSPLKPASTIVTRDCEAKRCSTGLEGGDALFGRFEAPDRGHQHRRHQRDATDPENYGEDVNSAGERYVIHDPFSRLLLPPFFASLVLQIGPAVMRGSRKRSPMSVTARSQSAP